MAIITPGLESKFTYGGLILNDKSTFATYRLLEIDGLGDPDIRDPREPNPGRHGETVYDAAYSGRTISLSGYIQANNLTELRTMQQTLRSSFASLTEKNLTITNPFDSTKNVTIKCRKSAPIVIKEVQPHSLFKRDFLITLRASDPRFYGITSTTSSISPATAYSAYDLFNQTSATLTGQTADIGGNWTAPGGLDADDFSVGSGVASRASTGVAGHAIPGRGVYLPASLGSTVAQIDFQYNGDMVSAVQSRLAARWSDMSNYIFLRAISNPNTLPYSTIVLVKRKAGADVTLDSVDVPKLVSGSWYTLRLEIEGTTAKGWLLSQGEVPPVTPLLEGTDADINTSPLNAGYAGFFDFYVGTSANTRKYDNFFAYDPDDFPEIVVNNAGNFISEPVIRFTGELEEPVLINKTTGQRIHISGTIADGDWIEIDLANNTTLNQDGANAFAQIAQDSSNPVLVAGNNTFELQQVSHSGVAEVEITHKAAYL